MLSFDPNVPDGYRERARKILAADPALQGADVVIRLGLGRGFARWVVQEAYVYRVGQSQHSEKFNLQTVVRDALRHAGESVDT